ncbi:hypothetical protein [Microbacterium sp. 22242]|uniref:hypothetical protein n=1 Tax=Microbacterium sp. 22242 TaxID=3453896 RepID=UPI003F86432E
MTNNPPMPLVPEDPEDELSDPPLVEDADGEEKLDPDQNEDRVDSADADRLAAETGTETDAEPDTGTREA